MTISEIDKHKKFFYLALFFNIALLLVHTTFLITFYLISVKEMFYFNIVSVSLYLFAFFLVFKQYIQAFLLLVIIEVQVHLVEATLLIGWESGFPMYPFGLIAVIYYTKYIYYDKKFMKPIPTIVSVSSIIEFLVLTLYMFHHEPYYTIDTEILHKFMIFNSMLIFMLIMVALIDYTNVVLETEKKLHNIADFDELTQVYTRRKIHEILNEYHKMSERGKKDFCISIIDVDSFKYINDTFGHDTGDYVLKTICRQINESLAPNEKKYTDLARWGGDEFLIVQQYDGKSTTLEQCRNAIETVQRNVSAYTFLSRGTRLPVSLTIGFASHHKGMSIDETFKTADENLYKGKVKGKNTVVF
ncbi:MAG: GGDEF domain-containing protein [Treponema sp.]|nr:GGDEF domain-containing protein [Treponema sp.]